MMSSSTDGERQVAVREQLQYAGQSGGELFLALAVRKRTDPEHQLRDRDAGEIERFRRLFVEPNAYGIVGCGLHRLGHDVGVEEDHSKLIGLAGVFARAWPSASASSLVSPRGRLRSARELPSRRRGSGRTPVSGGSDRKSC